MADVKLLIKIPEDIYNEIKEKHSISLEHFVSYTAYLTLAVEYGTPLPKGHKIIDATSLQEHLALVPMEDRTFRETVDIIDWFPSITETDKE